MHSLSSLPFSNSFAGLPEAFHARVQPTPLEHPARLVHFNPAAAALLELDPAVRADPEFPRIFSGSHPWTGTDPVAMRYSGHQFGHYVRQLGDGRAIVLGETTNSRGQHWEIQLKGGGQTPYSRDGDGRAVLRSTIREYLCSEAMHGLGIPTTRALCITSSADEVYRERIESAAVLTRLAPSHVRFGSFELFFYNNRHDELRVLADYLLQHHFPEARDEPEPYVALLNEVVDRTAQLLAHWQAVGFAHGVMNTDNMSVLGLTLDYGPFGFMEAFDPGFICNHSDHRGRYAFDAQPQVALFNLSCFAQALLPLLAVEDAKAALESFQPAYTHYYNALMAAKLGLPAAMADSVTLVDELLAQMAASATDYTNLFRALGEIALGRQDGRDHFIDRERFTRWRDDYLSLLQQQLRLDEDWLAHLHARNPKYILRNYLAQVAIDRAEQQDFSEIDRLFRLLQRPFDEQPEMDHYTAPPPDWARDIQVSCSS
jgi:protein adenylyltransferase